MSGDFSRSKIYQLHPIGHIRASDEEQKYILQIDQPYRSGLKQLDQFSHVMIFWWADQMDSQQYRQVMTTKLPYAPDVEAGVFACRSEYRPNPIAVSTIKILHVNIEAGEVVLPWIDAFDGTPILDLKPYIPISDRIRDFKVAEWLADWPEWMEDAEEYFAQHEVEFGE